MAMPARSSSSTSRTKAAGNTLPAPTLLRRVGWVLGLGAWLVTVASLMSFDRADAPSPFAAAWNQPAANWCGRVGAYLAYHAYAVIGVGIWVILLGAIAALVVTAAGRSISQLIIRAVGLLIMALAVSAMHGQLLPGIGPLPVLEGGTVAVYAVSELSQRFSSVGTFLCLLAALGLGAIVAVDRLVLALPRMLWQSLRATGHVSNKVREIPRPRLGLPRLRLSIPGFGSASVDDDADQDQEEWLEDDAAERPSRGKRRRKGRGGDSVLSISPDAGGVGATDAFDPEEEYQDDDDDIVDDFSDDEEEDFEDDLEEIEAIAAESSRRRRLSSDELREKIAKLPVRLAGTTKVIARDEEIPRQPADTFEDYVFPSLSLLEDPETNYSERMEKFVREQAQQLEESLQTYRIDGEVVGIDSGPVVTLYAVQLAPGTKVSKVTAVSSDIARSLRAQNIRIVPNMAGRTSIGIEVPNLHKEKVRLKELMSGGHADKMGLPMFLGKDASGEPLVADLTQMPHMLIAGTTGSGKSVCMNSIIMSWLYTKRPDELKLILVDPKMVELSQFQNIPHLMCPVVTEMSRAAAILEWAVTKMEERYELLSEATVRDIDGYNLLSEEELYERFEPANDLERTKIPKKLPFMVFIIDELADLMMTNKEVEHSIVRIAQKARAVGIHLILATQRPQANVVTGLIKSNMPCRVSFRVASGMDSRIVLDHKGAELLLGQGDMMYLAPHTSEVKRAQGTLVTDGEIRRVARFLKDVAMPNFERSLLSIRPGQVSDDAEGLDAAERDPLFDQAVVIMIESGRGSVSLLQRRLAIGYSRASRLVDQMGLAGILGEHRGSVARDVLITLDEWEEMKRLEAQAEAEGTLYAENATRNSDGEEVDDDGVALIETYDRDAHGNDDDDAGVPAEYGDEYLS
ncbi:MAG: DNA translocase FtsK 4TM domain-containing protein [Phycisphaerales bacterium]